MTAAKGSRGKSANLSTSSDPFATAAVRSAVLATWHRSPSRFREDANAEESLALIAYADRVVVELAANASDAAIAAGVRGVLRFSVVNGELRAANTGAPLTAEGVAALASLRASAKRGMAAGTGHFGVGFTAVLSVTDQPQIYSSAGGVEFSLAATIAAVEAQNSPDLSAELAMRHQLPPILRLPWPLPAEQLPTGFTTEVRLRLRQHVDVTTVLAAAGDYLLLTLPGLDSIELPDRTLTRRLDGPDLVTITDGVSTTTWRLARRSGVLSPELSAMRPIEERDRLDWWITWAAPAGRSLLGTGGSEVLYAPTPTDEILQLPARLIGTFPVDDSRRHLAVGPLADFMTGQAIEGYLDLLTSAEPSQRLSLIPDAGFGLSRMDTELRLAILEKARKTRLLVTVLGDAIAGESAVVLGSAPTELAEMVAEAIPNLVPAPESAAAAQTLRTLGVRTLETSEMSTALAGLGRGPRFWGRLYELLGYASGDDLADLPVPLADGRTVLGGRGLLIPEMVADSPDEQEYLAELMQALPGLRLVAPAAVQSTSSRQLLLRLGGTLADPSAILADPSVQAQIRSLQVDLDNDEPVEHFENFAFAMLSLIARGGRAPDGLFVDLILTSADDEPWPASQLLLPDSDLAQLIDPAADIPFVADNLVERFGGQVLAQAGVLASFRVLHDDSAVGPDHELPDESLWWEEVIGSSENAVRTFSAIADLDLIDTGKWPQALRMLSRNREALECLRSAPGSPITYSRWWIANFAALDEHPPNYWRLPTANDLGGLFDLLPADVDVEMAELVGVRTGLGQVLIDDVDELLDRLTNPNRVLAAGLVSPITQAVVDALLAQGRHIEPSDQVRVLSGEVIEADNALVLDEPWLAQVLLAAELVPGGSHPERIARFFDLELASVALAAGEIHPGGSRASAIGETTEAVAVTTAWQAIGGSLTDSGWINDVLLIAELTVTVDGIDRRVSWWRAGEQNWVDGSAAGWGRLMAYHLGQWSVRHLATAAVAGLSAELVEFGLD